MKNEEKALTRDLSVWFRAANVFVQQTEKNHNLPPRFYVEARLGSYVTSATGTNEQETIGTAFVRLGLYIGGTQ